MNEEYTNNGTIDNENNVEETGLGIGAIGIGAAVLAGIGFGVKKLFDKTGIKFRSPIYKEEPTDEVVEKVKEVEMYKLDGETETTDDD